MNISLSPELAGAVNPLAIGFGVLVAAWIINTVAAVFGGSQTKTGRWVKKTLGLSGLTAALPFVADLVFEHGQQLAVEALLALFGGGLSVATIVTAIKPSREIGVKALKYVGTRSLCAAPGAFFAAWLNPELFGELGLPAWAGEGQGLFTDPKFIGGLVLTGVLAFFLLRPDNGQAEVANEPVEPAAEDQTVPSRRETLAVTAPKATSANSSVDERKRDPRLSHSSIVLQSNRKSRRKARKEKRRAFQNA